MAQKRESLAENIEDKRKSSQKWVNLGKDFILKKEMFFFWREASLRAFSFISVRKLWAEAKRGEPKNN